MSVSFSQNIYFGRAFLPLANLKKVIWNRSFRSLKKWSSSLSVHFFWKKWSRSVQFSDLDHWTDLARSIQPCSDWWWSLNFFWQMLHWCSCSFTKLWTILKCVFKPWLFLKSFSQISHLYCIVVEIFSIFSKLTLLKGNFGILKLTISPSVYYCLQSVNVCA